MVESTSRDHVARAAAHTIIAGINPNQIPPQTVPQIVLQSRNVPQVNPEHSINSMEDYLREGTEHEGEMSPVRRFFSLFVTFDFFFTGFLWIICLVISGIDIRSALILQVVNFSVYSSLFDVVLTSLCRATFLLLSYALFRLSHWWTVALTTSGSSAFLIIKVILYHWNELSYNNNYHVFSVILILCSFVICWGEAWFLDFRVIPQEHRVRDYLHNISERSRLLPPNTEQRFVPTSGTDTLPFYSPVQSNHDSDNEDDIPDGAGLIHGEIQTNSYREKGKNTLEAALKLLSSDNWKLEKSSAGDTVHSKKLPKAKSGKIFKLTCVVPVKPKCLFDEIYTNVEGISEWNPNVACSQVIEKIDDHTDITYQASNEAGNGAVSVRDFVSLRYWELRSGMYMIGTTSVQHSKMPPKKEFVRGESEVGGCFLKPSLQNPNECIFEWILCIDLKGWLPQYLVDQTLANIMLEYVHYIRIHLNCTTLANSI